MKPLQVILAAIAGTLCAPRGASAWTVQYLDTLNNPGAISAFASTPPTITVIVDTTTGDVKLVGSAGAIMNQYCIYSLSGSLIKDNQNAMATTHDSIAGMENYQAWMTMYAVTNPDNDSRFLSLGDKACPINDPLVQGAVYFDNLENSTLDLGQIWDVTLTTDPSDLVFTFSYGYVKKESQSDLNSVASNYNFITGTGTGVDEDGDGIRDGDGQIMLQYSFPRPDGFDLESITGNIDPLAACFPDGDGVSAFGTIVLVPEPASMFLMAGGGLTLVRGRKQKRFA